MMVIYLLKWKKSSLAPSEIIRLRLWVIWDTLPSEPPSGSTFKIFMTIKCDKENILEVMRKNNLLPLTLSVSKNFPLPKASGKESLWKADFENRFLLSSDVLELFLLHFPSNNQYLLLDIKYISVVCCLISLFILARATLSFSQGSSLFLQQKHLHWH